MGVPSEILEQMIRQQDERRQRQTIFFRNIMFVVVGYIMFFYIIPMIMQWYTSYKAKEKELLILRKRMRESESEETSEPDRPRVFPSSSSLPSSKPSPKPAPFILPRPTQRTTSSPLKDNEREEENEHSLGNPVPPPRSTLPSLSRPPQQLQSQALSQEESTASASPPVESALRRRMPHSQSSATAHSTVNPWATMPSATPSAALLADRRLRAEQDREYEESMRREAQKHAESVQRDARCRAALELEQQQAKKLSDEYNEMLTELRRKLTVVPMEPDAAPEGAIIISLSFRFSGTGGVARVDRKFLSSHTDVSVLDFIETHSLFLSALGLSHSLQDCQESGQLEVDKETFESMRNIVRQGAMATIAYPKRLLSRTGCLLGELLEGGSSAVIHVVTT